VQGPNRGWHWSSRPRSGARGIQ